MKLTAKKFAFDTTYGATFEVENIEVIKNLMEENDIKPYWLLDDETPEYYAYKLKGNTIEVYYNTYEYHYDSVNYELKNTIELDKETVSKIKAFAFLIKALFPEKRLNSTIIKTR